MKHFEQLLQIWLTHFTSKEPKGMRNDWKREEQLTDHVSCVQYLMDCQVGPSVLLSKRYGQQLFS